MNNKPYSARHVRTRKGDVKYKLRLKERCEYIRDYPGVTEETTDSGKTYYKEWFDSISRKKFYKKYASKKERKARFCLRGSGYKKAYDLWWDLD